MVLIRHGCFLISDVAFHTLHQRNAQTVVLDMRHVSSIREKKFPNGGICDGLRSLANTLLSPR